MKKRFPGAVYNPLSMAGALLASISFGIIACLIVIETFMHNPNPYLGIITFMILPGFLVFGLLLIAFGVYRERKRLQRGETEAPRFPVLNLNDPKQRYAVMFFAVATSIIVLFSAFGSYKAYEFSESDEFCGTVCHKVMSPEYTAYQLSAHSRVGCVKCHIGSGADWFVKAKISGSYQVYSVLFDKYARPIETPIANLRPAQETCEQCHWPKHFFSQKKMVFHYFNSDETNTESSLAYLMKIGGGNGETGTEEGIHYHMNIANAVYYKTTDRERQIIPWVKIVRKNGKEEVFKVKDYKEENHEIRRMDCIDCHNRPAHVYNPAEKMVNLSMTRGRIRKDLPYIKAIAVKAIETPYTSTERGTDSIKNIITSFYRSNYPDIYNSRSGDIDAAVKEAQTIFAQNFFPFMRVSWKRYPNNRGHMYFDGCFRCHDGKHVNDEGKVITNDCNACHTIIQQSGATVTELKQTNLSGLDYVHPASVGNVIDQKCIDCHNKKDASAHTVSNQDDH